MRPLVRLAAAVLALAACKGDPPPSETPAPMPATAAPLPTGAGCWSRRACAKACTAGVGPACSTLADFQELGAGDAAPDERSDARARACDAGDADACATLAGALAPDAEGRDAAIARARAASDAACAKRDGDGCLTAARLDPAADKVAIAARMIRACDLSSADACHRILTYELGAAVTGEENVLPADAADRARVMLARLCAANDGMACFSLALHGANAKAAARADAIFDARCAAGHPWSCSLLGSLRRDLRDDAPGAVAAYRRGCDAGLPDACAHAVPPNVPFAPRPPATARPPSAAPPATRGEATGSGDEAELR